MAKDIEIYVAMHKEDIIPIVDDMYCYVQAGTALNKKIENVYHDDDGVNISLQNPYYCELTVFYWGWKNSQKRIKGLCHYRRFFSNSYVNYNNKFFLNEKQIEAALNKYDIIVPTQTYYEYIKIKDSYTIGDCGKKNDLVILRKVLKDNYPDYLKYYDELMQSYKMSYFNMLIARQEIYDKYAEWLFDVLKKAEKYIDMNERSGNQRRVYGYFGERLLNVWIKKNNLSVKYYPVIKIENNTSSSYKYKCFLDRLRLFRPAQLVKDYIKLKKVHINESIKKLF